MLFGVDRLLTAIQVMVFVLMGSVLVWEIIQERPAPQYSVQTIARAVGCVTAEIACKFFVRNDPVYLYH